VINTKWYQGGHPQCLQGVLPQSGRDFVKCSDIIMSVAALHMLGAGLLCSHCWVGRDGVLRLVKHNHFQCKAVACGPECCFALFLYHGSYVTNQRAKRLMVALITPI
jgi:hypothetical protein